MKIVESGYIIISEQGVTFADFIFDMTDAEASLSNEELEILAMPLCLEWAKEILFARMKTCVVEKVVSRGTFTPPKGELH